MIRAIVQDDSQCRMPAHHTQEDTGDASQMAATGGHNWSLEPVPQIQSRGACRKTTGLRLDRMARNGPRAGRSHHPRRVWLTIGRRHPASAALACNTHRPGRCQLQLGQLTEGRWSHPGRIRTRVLRMDRELGGGRVAGLAAVGRAASRLEAFRKGL